MTLARFALTVAILMGIAMLPIPAAGLETIYETGPRGLQNMDYDAANKTFPAHSGWLDDRPIHYYKFRLYTPETYPTKVTSGQPPQIPIAPVYLPTRNGTLAGATGQMPILRYHTQDGEKYSDFAEIHLFNFSGRPPTSFDGIDQRRSPPFATGIIVNMPVVPTGSRLADPAGGSAPIKPRIAWYMDEEVQTFTFETSSAELARMWNLATRSGTASDPGSGYEMTVASMRAGRSIRSVPIWQVDQYSELVTPGVDSGGPSSLGMRNVIDVERSEPGYSPLRQVLWVKQLAPGYGPDMASDADQFTDANGFGVEAMPWFVNGPNVGPTGGEAANSAKRETFDPTADMLANPTVELQGALMMMSGKQVTAKLNGDVIANATTDRMGAYSFVLDATKVAQGASTLTVEDEAGNVVATWSVTKGTSAAAREGSMLRGIPFAWGLLVVGVLLGAIGWPRKEK